MTLEAARTAMITGVSVRADGRTYKIRSICEIPVSALNAHRRAETLGARAAGAGAAPTTYVCELLNNANCVEYAMLEDLEDGK